MHAGKGRFQHIPVPNPAGEVREGFSEQESTGPKGQENHGVGKKMDFKSQILRIQIPDLQLPGSVTLLVVILPQFPVLKMGIGMPRSHIGRKIRSAQIYLLFCERHA